MQILFILLGPGQSSIPSQNLFRLPQHQQAFSQHLRHLVLSHGVYDYYPEISQNTLREEACFYKNSLLLTSSLPLFPGVTHSLAIGPCFILILAILRHFLY